MSQVVVPLSPQQRDHCRENNHTKRQHVIEERNVEHSEKLVRNEHTLVSALPVTESDSQWALVSIFVLLIAQFVGSTLLTGSVVDGEHCFAELPIGQLFEAFVLHRTVHIVVEFCDNSQSDKVKYNVDCIISRAYHTNIRQLDCQARHILKHTGKPSDLRVLEFVRVIHRVLHHLKTCMDLIDARQMQNCGTNEASKDNEHVHLLDDDLTVCAVGHQLVESHHNQGELQYEGQNHVHCDVKSLLLFDFKASFFQSVLFSNFLILFN